MNSSTEHISNPPSGGVQMVRAANPPSLINSASTSSGLKVNQSPGYAHALFASDITTTPMKIPPPPNRSQSPSRSQPVAGNGCDLISRPFVFVFLRFGGRVSESVCISCSCCSSIVLWLWRCFLARSGSRLARPERSISGPYYLLPSVASRSLYLY